MIWDDIFINSLGTYIPPRFSSDAVDCSAEINDDFSGYESVAISEEPSYIMAGIAARQAMERSQHSGNTLSALVYVHTLLDTEHATPASYLQRVLQQTTALTFELSAASDGGTTGVEVVARLLASDPGLDAGLVCTTNRIPDGIDRFALGGVNGDGAAAAVISKRNGFARLVATQRAADPEFEALNRNRATQVGFWDIEYMDVGFQYIDALAQEVSAIISSILSEANLRIEDISHFCFPAIAADPMEEMFLKRNKIPVSKTCWAELRKNGHVGPCDQLLGLAHLADTNQLKPGQFVLLVGGGLGYRLTSLLLQVV